MPFDAQFPLVITYKNVNTYEQGFGPSQDTNRFKEDHSFHITSKKGFRPRPNLFFDSFALIRPSNSWSSSIGISSFNVRGLFGSLTDMEGDEIFFFFIPTDFGIVAGFPKV